LSLKAFHVVFITAAVLLAIWLGVWAWRQRQTTGAGSWLALSVGSFATAGGLVAYEVWFLRKTRQVSPW
jgi:hypothetical protein